MAILLITQKIIEKIPKTKPHTVKEELGDLLHLLLAFANKMEIDCEEALSDTNKKIKN